MYSQWVLPLSAAVLLALIYAVKHSRLFNLFDHELHHLLVRRHDGFGWQIIAFICDPKLVVVWTVLLASYYIKNDQFMTGFWILGTLGITDAIGIVMKKSIRRKRPNEHLTLDAGYSFPSGHVLSSTILMLILLQLFGAKFGWVFGGAIIAIWLMVIISRLSLKAHYPSDVIGAASLAIFCFSLSNQVLLVIH
ncbi:phosphatase PAP2 family protein [Lactobacillus corticis]|uniref:Membrane-associated phospholipid phosphatase n=1 Tax=Lactobacillus corticis TaxID=2201249 RepID=A0A916QHZ1_9LACO|nr:phosphatase PAP2 family protein [Lactobacillus corticis]GFZ27679.1 membrane-associated phospholipid phosphatase [Lactobacillus corticis]